MGKVLSCIQTDTLIVFFSLFSYFAKQSRGFASSFIFYAYTLHYGLKCKTYFIFLDRKESFNFLENEQLIKKKKNSTRGEKNPSSLEHILRG